MGTINIVRVYVKSSPAEGRSPHEGLLKVERPGFKGFGGLGFRV